MTFPSPSMCLTVVVVIVIIFTIVNSQYHRLIILIIFVIIVILLSVSEFKQDNRRATGGQFHDANFRDYFNITSPLPDGKEGCFLC